MSYVISKLQIQTTRYKHAPLRITNTKSPSTTNIGEDVELQNMSFIVAGYAKGSNQI
jgi:hypothetical protein